MACVIYIADIKEWGRHRRTSPKSAAWNVTSIIYFSIHTSVCNPPPRKFLIFLLTCTTMQNQNVVTTYFTSKQLLPFELAQQCNTGLVIRYPGITRRLNNVGLMLGQRRRRWTNIEPTFVQYSVASWVMFMMPWSINPEDWSRQSKPHGLCTGCSDKFWHTTQPQILWLVWMVGMSGILF